MNGQNAPSNRRNTGAVLLEFLGSMNLAITLLVAVAIAAVIGTVLQQNQPYNDYVIKFGPFWFDVFRALGLYNIYGSLWFLALLGFLLISTAVCVFRNAPAILRDMSQFRLDVQDKSLRAFHLRSEWQASEDPTAMAQRFDRVLQLAGYRVRHKSVEGVHTVAAMKGVAGRLGYLLTHVAIVVICLGGLIDGNLPLHIAEYAGRIAPETRDIPVSQVPAKSVLSATNSSFRGDVSIPEGSAADFVFLGLDNGYLVQKLPFKVALNDFRIEHYPSGQPKSFESDIEIIDSGRKEPLRTTIAVNHPLFYKGYAIYQASFSDGGSKLFLKAWPLDLPDGKPLDLEGQIGSQLKLNTPRGERTIELTDFKPLNVFPVPKGDPSGRPFRNYGPSVVFKVRDASGVAREYVNYMAPVPIDGHLFFLSGMRETSADDYRYLQIPLDDKGSIDRFLKFRARIMDPVRLRKVVDSQVSEISAKDSPLTPDQLSESITHLVELFATRGIDAVVAEAHKHSKGDDANAALNAYVKVIQNALAAEYVGMLRDEGKAVDKGVGAKDQRFFEDSLNALSLIGPYGSPFIIQLTHFKEVQASGLQITKSPGKDIVYAGCIMLIAGVFFMFYLHHRRVWIRLNPMAGGTTILFAGAAHRGRADFGTEFSALAERLKAASGASTTERGQE